MAGELETITVELKDPIGRRSNPITKLELKRPKVRDLRLAIDRANGDVDKIRRLIAVCCDLEPPIIDQMELGDFTRATDALMSVLPAEFLEDLLKKPEDPDEREIDPDDPVDEDAPGKGEAGGD